MKRVFIDGSAGTTGLQIYERLSARTDIELNILPEELRKDPDERRWAVNEADIVFLCLPDQAAVEAAGWVENPGTVVIDTSTAHRTAPGWVYGFPELAVGPELAEADAAGTPGGRMHAVLRRAGRIANPGCHASGFIALVSPLIQAGLIARDAHLSCFSVTGYSGGGKQMIADYEQARGVEPSGAPQEEETAQDLYESPRQYALAQQHKHIPEMQTITGLMYAPVFVPVVADYRQGMEVTVPLFADQVNLDCDFLKHADIVGAGSKPTLIEAVSAVYRKAYGGPVVHFEEHPDEDGFMAAGKLSGRDDMEITVAGNDERAVLVARFDNLGKGACGAAIQNMNLVLGCEETTGLVL